MSNEQGASSSSSSSSSSPCPPKVAIIGCGASGMFFLHALATRIRDAEDDDTLSSLPLVTCFEMSNGAGGIWRAPTTPDKEKEDNEEETKSDFWEEGGKRRSPDGSPSTNMYDGLWCNAAKECVEFPDYSFKEHFNGCEVPAYLPRADMLRYVFARTTSVDPNLLLHDDNTTSTPIGRKCRHNIKFETTVVNASFDQTKEKFVLQFVPTSVRYQRNSAAFVKEEEFDFCIWAAGQNAKPRIPKSLLALLRTGKSLPDDNDDDTHSDDSFGRKNYEQPVPFKGDVLHSSHVRKFDQVVPGATIVLIGDSSSSEDLALRAIRLGVKHVHILSRSGEGEATYVGSWPGDSRINANGTKQHNPKVTIHSAMPCRVIQNGHGLLLRHASDDDDSDQDTNDGNAEIELTPLNEVAAVVFCTGYLPNLDCIHPSLRFSTNNTDATWEPSKDFSMKPNPFTPEIGDIQPSSRLYYSDYAIPGLFRNLFLLTNPRMIYLTDLTAEYPLLELDVKAWLALAMITGDAAVPPTLAERNEETRLRLMEEMDVAYLRWYIDPNYADAMDIIYDDDNHWCSDYSDERTLAVERQFACHFAGLLARDMKDSKYPANFGDYGNLNETGKKHAAMALSDSFARYTLDPMSPDSSWRTFRDADPSQFRSVHTNQMAAPLPRPWLELDIDNTTFTASVKCSWWEKWMTLGRHATILHPNLPLPPSSTSPPTVALIGCGPAGMFFLHALATRRNELQQAGDLDDLAKLPRVICFEAMDGPGGLWRSPKTSSNQQKQQQNNPCGGMYDAMWTNLPKEAVEFSDYTFQDHFEGQTTPAYLPRRDVLDYVLKRTTCADPDLYSSAMPDDPDEEKKEHLRNGNKCHEIRFRTIVLNVEFDDSTQKFEVESTPFYDAPTKSNRRQSSLLTTKERFDYCIWAAGLHSKPRIPLSSLRLLRSGGSRSQREDSSDSSYTSNEQGEEENSSKAFKGTILHSSHMAEFDGAVKGKTIVLIGDANSAEDLALQAVKVGAGMVHILSRSGYGICPYVGSWPGTENPKTGRIQRKIKVHIALPYRVINNGTGLKCNAMTWNHEEEVYEIDDDLSPIFLTNVDTIIFCTGYLSNLDFLSPELQHGTIEDDFWEPPPEFQMKPNHLTRVLGEVQPSEELDPSETILPNVFRNVLISNPRMMYISERSDNHPLLELDVGAWLCLAYITGEANIPNKEEMERLNMEQRIEELHNPIIRWEVDINYFDAIDDLPDGHWTDNPRDKRSIEMNEEYFKYYTGLLARDMATAKYPTSFGSQRALNKLGEKHAEILQLNAQAREFLDAKSSDSAWKTFRDTNPENFRSIFTNQCARALPSCWISLDSESKERDCIVLKEEPTC